MTLNPDRKEQRIAYWGDSYLQSTKESHRRAKEFRRRRDYFTAYLYLFIAFNNLYCLLTRFSGSQPTKIRAAVGLIADEGIASIYTAGYVRHLVELNQRVPEQFSTGPDKGAAQTGIVNMGDYFLGKDPDACIARIDNAASVDAPTEEKRRTLKEMAASLLYTVRNNQFHAIKGAHILADETTLEVAYKLLEPLVRALIPVGRQEIEVAKEAVSMTREGKT
jgi:hypothetical protein